MRSSFPYQQEEIIRLKKEKMQFCSVTITKIDPIQEVADYVGDSLGLARQAAQTDADIIVFCGVHFMAETAKIFNPSKTVLLPDLDAGCSLSDSCPADQLAKYREENPDLYVVAYVNCSAAVKGLSDVICTSGNAVKIVNQVPARPGNSFCTRSEPWPVGYGTDRHGKCGYGQAVAMPMCFLPRNRSSVAVWNTLMPRWSLIPNVSNPCAILLMKCAAPKKWFPTAKAIQSDTFIILTESGMMHRLTREFPQAICCWTHRSLCLQ
jgi:quinolinate synthase